MAYLSRPPGPGACSLLKLALSLEDGKFSGHSFDHWTGFFQALGCQLDQRGKGGSHCNIVYPKICLVDESQGKQEFDGSYAFPFHWGKDCGKPLKDQLPEVIKTLKAFQASVLAGKAQTKKTSPKIKGVSGVMAKICLETFDQKGRSSLGRSKMGATIPE